MSESHRLWLDVYGVRVLVTGEDRDALEGIGAQFLGFTRADDPRSPHVRVALRPLEASPLSDTRLVADQVVDRGIVYNRGDRVLVDHHGQSAIQFDYAAERGDVYARDPADAIEQAYLMIHSRLGPLLEAKGLVRVHACGVAVHGRAALVLAPSGGGKSRLAVALLRHADHEGEVRLLGDDMVLVDAAGRAWPFPHPIGVSDRALGEGLGDVRRFSRRTHGDKFLVGGAPVLARHAEGAHQVVLVALLTRASAPPTRAVPASRPALLEALFRDAVVGLGLPQVIEMVARRGARDLFGLGPTALRRARHAWALARHARAVHLEVHRPDDAASWLVEQLADHG